MDSITDLLGGKVADAEVVLGYLRRDLFPAAVKLLDDEWLPLQCSLFSSDALPTNQRNLTDVRTRVGVLLEYQLGKAIERVLPQDILERLSMTFVLANKFPDLAFRGRAGETGVRFEVKAVQAVAEEKAANFDTLFKDIRKGTDFVVVLLWEWERHASLPLSYPRIDSVFVLDAYQLAQMRDCYWLNCPPTDVEPGRQGFDLCFGVNCSKGKYNHEEGNYGKLMRIFDEDFEQYLAEEARSVTTLKEYYLCRDRIYRLGLERIADRIMASFGARSVSRSKGLPLLAVAEGRPGRVLIAAAAEMPSPREVVPIAVKDDIQLVLLMNAKFRWQVCDRTGRELGRGSKPRAAMEWFEGWAKRS